MVCVCTDSSSSSSSCAFTVLSGLSVYVKVLIQTRYVGVIVDWQTSGTRTNTAALTTPMPSR